MNGYKTHVAIPDYQVLSALLAGLLCLLTLGCRLTSSWSFDPGGGGIDTSRAARPSLSRLRFDPFFSDAAKFSTGAFRFDLKPGRGEIARSFGGIRFHGSSKGSPSFEESVGRLKAVWARARRATLCVAVANLRLKFLSMVAEV